MNKLLSMLTIGTVLSVSSAAFAACPDPASGNANSTLSERAWDLYVDGAKTFAVDIGGSTPWSTCGIQGDGFLPSQASVRLDLRAAEGKKLIISLNRGCPITYMFVSAGDFRGVAHGNPETESVSVIVPQSDIGNDQTVMIYLSADQAGYVCEGEISFRTSTR